MTCPQCKEAALSKAKFCSQCGSRVGIDCPACGMANALESKFCRECGQLLHPTPKKDARQAESYTEVEKGRFGIQGERRHLTVLFSDVTGYTRMMEKHDPEDIQALMQSITKSSIEIIEAYNGHVERILGDEVLAVFGLPAAHEDDAIRAIKAARDIHSVVKGLKPPSIDFAEPIAMHTGINTGPSPFDMVIMDMLMPPGMDGPATYGKILKINPGQKAIIASGYAETGRVKKALNLGVGQFIKKPYTIEDVGLVVERELRVSS